MVYAEHMYIEIVGGSNQVIEDYLSVVTVVDFHRPKSLLHNHTFFMKKDNPFRRYCFHIGQI